ncbi:winged helix-turn-helix transcriptional regulator [Streptomyces sp. NPDC085932]|uniref:winged helix-turn-helix transcriptional regulator n=1 Tax=Streptomyces sp. NPDC085932 TaxID=3365741 RepID=UPI0037D13BEA
MSSMEDGTFKSATHTGVRAPGHEVSDRCQVREILARVGEKWSILAIVLLQEGDLRYSELHRRMEGVSQRMLTLTLRGLERDGLIERTVIPSTPPRVSYSLTKTGHSLSGPLTTLLEWAEEHQGDIEQSRVRYDLGTKG